MSIRKDVYVQCDDCGEVAAYYSGKDARQARQEASRNGWVRSGGKDYCTRCYKKQAGKHATH